MSDFAFFAAEPVEAEALRREFAAEPWLDAPFRADRAGDLLIIEGSVGKCAAASCLAWAHGLGVRSGVWVGVAGALSPDLKQMDLLIAREAVQWDVDITAFGRAPGEDAEGQRFLPADPELVERLTRAAPEARLGRIASGDSFLADRERARLIRQVQEADAVEMEGAAALWAARRFGIRLALLRAISDSGDGSAAESFDVFLPRASARLAEVCRRLIDLP